VIEVLLIFQSFKSRYNPDFALLPKILSNLYTVQLQLSNFSRCIFVDRWRYSIQCCFDCGYQFPVISQKKMIHQCDICS